MADEPISGLPETTSVTGNEFVPIVQSGVTKKIKQSNLVPNQASFSTTVLFDSNITMVAGVIYLEKNTNASNRTLTIPSATGNTGKFIFVAKQYNNGYTITCSGGGISSTLTRSNDSVLYVCDGTSWQPHLNISNELLLAISGKEPTIASGTTSQYWRGDKTWQTFPTATVPNLDEVTDVGNTTTNEITVGGLTVNYPSGAGVAASITKGGAGEALTVTKTSGSGNVASFTGGVTSFSDIEVTSATASTPTFFNSAKKLISATGAFLGTWFQTLTADTNPVDADTIVVNDSTASFEAKKTTLLQLWTNYLLAKVQALGYLAVSGLTANRLPYWNGTTFVDSRFVRATDDSTISFVPTSGSNTLSIGNAGIRLTGGNIDIVSGSFDGLQVTGRIISRSSDNYAYQVSGSGSNFYFGLGGTNTGVFRTVSNICMSVNDNGVAIGTGTVNSLTQLDLQATDKGLGLNLIAGNLGTTRNGNIWYDTVANSFKGVANSSVVSFLTSAGGTLTGALNEATIVSLASASNVDIVNIAGNTALITGTTTIDTFTAGTSGMIRRVIFSGSLTLTGNANIRLPNNANTITTTAQDVATFVYSSSLALWLCVSYSSATPLTITRVPVFDATGKLVNSQIIDNGTSVFFTAAFKSIVATGRVVSNANNEYSIQVGNESTNAFFYGIGSSNTGVLRTVSGICMSVNDNGVAIGTGSVNARSQLHLQATNKGFLPNVLTTAQRDAVSWVAGDAGMIIYNSTTNKHQGWNGTTWNDMY